MSTSSVCKRNTYIYIYIYNPILLGELLEGLSLGSIWHAGSGTSSASQSLPLARQLRSVAFFFWALTVAAIGTPRLLSVKPGLHYSLLRPYNQVLQRRGVHRVCYLPVGPEQHERKGKSLRRTSGSTQRAKRPPQARHSRKTGHFVQLLVPFCLGQTRRGPADWPCQTVIHSSSSSWCAFSAYSLPFLFS